MSRRGGSVYEEREQREYYREPAAPVRTRERDYEEVDIYTRREREGSRPEFLREEYGRTDPGPLVLRERETETFSRPRPRSPSPVRVVRERVVERPQTPPERVRTTTRVVERERRSPSPPPERLRARVIETRERVRERSPSPVRVVRERYIERKREPSPSPPQVERVRIRNVEREIERLPSPSPSPSPSPPPSIRAPPIHQEIITHHRHIDHGYERAPAPSPPPPPRRSEPRTKETDIDIYTSRNNTEVDITKTTRSRTPQPTNMTRRDNFYDDSILYDQDRDRLRVREERIDIDRRRSASARPERREAERVRIDIRDDEEADYYARKAEERAYIGEAYNGATKDWAIVDVPPGTERVKMDGVGGGSQEITWQRYNGVRRSKFIPERERERERERDPDRTFARDRIEIRDEPRQETTGLEIEISSRRREPSGGYEREYERIEESTDRRLSVARPPRQRSSDLWTEITKDLVSREAIELRGYDFEETEYFYYIIQYLKYEDVLDLVQLSEKIRRERRDRIRQIERERERIDRRERDREVWERNERPRDDTYTDERRIFEREIIRGGEPRRGGW